MENLKDEYKRLCEECLKTDYANKKSVKKRNDKVKRMYEIVEKINSSGLVAIQDFSTLLTQATTAEWLSHQLVEKCNLPNELEIKCFSIVENLSKGDTTDALGNKMWLDEWKKKKQYD